MIPVPVIMHFLDDAQQAQSEGVPILGTTLHNTENQSLRRYYKIPSSEGGVVVNHVVPFSSADGLLQEGDVILELDGVPIGPDGTATQFPHQNALPCNAYRQ